MPKPPAEIIYTITFFSNPTEDVHITREQYEKLKKLINTNRFVEIDESTYNTSDIKRLKRTVKESPIFMRIGDQTFYSEAEYNAWMNGTTSNGDWYDPSATPNE